MMHLNSDGGWVGVGGEMQVLEMRQEWQYRELLKLGDGYMGVRYTILFASYMFEIFQEMA